MLLVFNRLTAGSSEVRFGILLGFETHSYGSLRCHRTVGARQIIVKQYDATHLTTGTALLSTAFVALILFGTPHKYWPR